MKQKPHLDLDFGANGRYFPRIRLFGLRLIAIASSGAIVCGLTLACRMRAVAEAVVPPQNVRVAFVGLKQRQAPPRADLAWSGLDPFVIMARVDLDAEMVVAAPSAIDEAMVHHYQEGQIVSGSAIVPPLNAGDPRYGPIPIPEPPPAE